MPTSEMEKMLGRYAELILKVGLNLQPGQELLVDASGEPENAVPFMRQIAAAAYRAGAHYVDARWSDDQQVKIRVAEAAADSLDYVPQWLIDRRLSAVERGAAYLSIYAPDPDLLAGQDPQRITRMTQAQARAGRPISQQTSRLAINWLIIAVPTAAWADKVFPDLPESERIPRLWREIFSVLRLDQDDPVAAWEAHIAALTRRRETLNQKSYDALHFRGPGTDLTVGLVPGHIWQGGRAYTIAGLPFVPNLPTEEIFSLPHRERVTGTVRATRPLNFQGVLIDDFSLTFENGRVTAVQAAQGEEILRQIIETDDGAGRLGEVALVPYDSPISRSGLLFYNTLFDENAASHVALGRAYPINLVDGTTMDDDTFQAAGGNVSNIHIDFMIGSAEIDVDGLTAAGEREPLMRAGDWVF